MVIRETGETNRMKKSDEIKIMVITFISTRTTSVQSPSNVSHGFILSRLENIALTASTKSSALPGIPKRDLNCEAAMLIAAAEVKPVITGSDIKSNRKPDRINQ